MGSQVRSGGGGGGGGGFFCVPLLLLGIKWEKETASF